MSAEALIDAIVADDSSFKQVGRQLELLPPSQEAADRLVAAYREGRLEGWLAVYLLGCIGHAAGYETGKSILLSNNGSGYAGVALVKMDKARAYKDLRQIIFNEQHPRVRREACHGLALYGSVAIDDFLTAYNKGLLPRRNDVSYHIARCCPTDALLLELLGSQDRQKQKLAIAVVECLISENMQLRPPGMEVATAVRKLLQQSEIDMTSRRREKLTAWIGST
jgi:hypothetical protein